MSGIGHNGGPGFGTGIGWQKHCWTKARAELLPRLPLEVIRWRVNRARQIGLPYRTYASVRATTGRDIIAFLFSSNALHMVPPKAEPGPERAAALARIEGCARHLALHAPLSQGDLPVGLAVDFASPAPRFTDGFADTRAKLRAALGPSLPSDAVLLVYETAMEREWIGAGNLAGGITGEAWANGTPG
ncbi:MAG: hypothetical protein ACPGID_05140 [Rubricella sp.]